MKLEILLTDDRNVGPDGWRHVIVSGTADTEQEARGAAQAAKMMFLGDAYKLRERVPFEYRQIGPTLWNLFGRFSFK